MTLEPFVGTCGDPQLLLVPSNPDRESGWQLRSRDRTLLEEAREQLGGVILATEDDIDEWLGEAPDADA